jgi:hypothetical protein
MSARVLAGELAFAAPKRWTALLRSYEGQDVRVNIEPIGRGRTLDQNARYWGLIIAAFSDWSGYEPDECHELLKALLLPPVVQELPDGQRIERVASTATLTVEQFTEFMDRAERYLIGHGVSLEER